MLHRVQKALEKTDLGSVRLASVDEICRKRYQNYLSLLSEAPTPGTPRRVLLALEGRDSGTLAQFMDHIRPWAVELWGSTDRRPIGHGYG